MRMRRAGWVECGALRALVPLAQPTIDASESSIQVAAGLLLLLISIDLLHINIPHRDKWRLKKQRPDRAL